MQISRNLKLVIPIYDKDELKIQIYAEPLTRLAFEANYKIMARAWSDLNASGIGSVGLMTTATFALKDAAIALYGEAQGESRYDIFMIELLNQAQAIIPESGSWRPVPYENAKGSKLISEDDVSIIESLIVFFTLASRMVDPNWGAVLRTAIELNYNAQFTSLGCMEYSRSLKTSTATESSGKKTT